MIDSDGMHENVTSADVFEHLVPISGTAREGLGGLLCWWRHTTQGADPGHALYLSASNLLIMIQARGAS